LAVAGAVQMMLLFRLISPIISAGLISDFVYFLEYLTFIVMLIALLLSELEFAKASAEDLLLEQLSRNMILSFS
tara:strand:+ start:211 stop:432 length:222 start_codon:yes stop_codon:yes gene_type:complete